MTVQASDSEVLVSALAEHARTAIGEHPEVETLLDYLTGELAAEAAAEVNDHLVGCRRCSEQLLDLEPLSQPDIPREGVADLATEAAWREMKARLFPAEAAPVPVPIVRPAAYQRWSIGIAAALLLTTGGMSAWVAQLQGRVAELSQLQVNMPVFYIGEATRSIEEESIEVPAGTSRFVLIFTPAHLESYSEYEVRFLDPEGEELLHVSGLKMSESGGLRLGASPEQLPAGRYLVRLNGFDGERWQELEEYSYRIAYPEGT